VYVGVWADDPQPEQIRALLTRRDVDAPADAVTVAFDSYHDRRTAYAFQLNAAGVQRDMLLFDDSNSDDTWDAVWTGGVSVTPTGWTAEYRIPLSQLRFASADSQEWGLQLLRVVGRTGEQDSWSPWPRSAPQVVSKFGVVDGIDHVGGGTRLELLPYATAGIDRMPIDAGDPLNASNHWRRNAGLDLKYGLGPAFTLSATLNPDFGQVEADPSKINLSASELFFAEKRPFFLEGMDLFKLPIGNSDNGVEGAFYSRRIGAAPATPDELALRILVPAFMISELKRAFEIGFLLFLPFLIIDLVVASVLMSMGMMMLPPVVVSLPFKLIFFVLVDGWSLVAGSLVQSYGG